MKGKTKTKKARIEKFEGRHVLRCPNCNRILLSYGSESLFILIEYAYCCACDIRIAPVRQPKMYATEPQKQIKIKIQQKPLDSYFARILHKASQPIQLLYKHTNSNLALNYQRDVQALIAYIRELERILKIESLYL